MKSAFSDEVSGSVAPADQPMAPGIISVTMSGNKATLTVQLPGASIDGQPLPAGALNKLHVYADKRSFLGRLEELLGMEPEVTQDIATTPLAAQATVDLPGLDFDTKYYFRAQVE